jgi:hypothetical protein
MLPLATLNKQLYITHLECSNYWQDTWFCIQTSINQKINNNIDLFYDKLIKKLNTLHNKKCKQTQKHEEHSIRTQKTFYTRIKTLSNTMFNKEEK